MSNLSQFSVEELRNIHEALQQWAELAEVDPRDAYSAIDKELRKRALKVIDGG